VSLQDPDSSGKLAKKFESIYEELIGANFRCFLFSSGDERYMPSVTEPIGARSQTVQLMLKGELPILTGISKKDAEKAAIAKVKEDLEIRVGARVETEYVEYNPFNVEGRSFDFDIQIFPPAGEDSPFHKSPNVRGLFGPLLEGEYVVSVSVTAAGSIFPRYSRK